MGGRGLEWPWVSPVSQGSFAAVGTGSVTRAAGAGDAGVRLSNVQSA
jgi:hypothetical protein